MRKKTVSIAVLFLAAIGLLITATGDGNCMQGKSEITQNVTVVYDNNPCLEGLETAWGFSCVVRGLEKTVLFDTGGDGARLLRNMERLGIDPGEVDIVVLSHIHGDHTGGLHAFLEKNPNVTVYVPESFPERFKKEAEGYGAVVLDVKKPVNIFENVYSTGEMGDGIKEQALVVGTDRGLVVITGCAHPGIVEIIETAKSMLNDDVLLAIGGYHLGGKSREALRGIVSDFRRLGVRYVGPCHCTGGTAMQLFEEEYKDNFIRVGVGKVISVEDLR
jgi:7,8-dihydropterin-6-yl-methyl-4-(beta-D-ribofuranosyl)aminobenzene 5'-phosphate synthase